MPDGSLSISTGPTSHVTLALNDTILTLRTLTKSKPQALSEIPLRQVLKANLQNESRNLTVTYLLRNNKKSLGLHVVEGKVEESEVVRAEQWVNTLMNTIYEDAGIQRSRRLMVFVNPHGGRKKGAAIFVKEVEPILKAAGCSLEVLYTTHQGHAHEVAKTMPLDFDAVITVSGDGLIHEVLNAFALHADPIKALATPVAPIPTGTGNGLSLNLLGIEDGFDVCAAALNAVKGKPMKVDLFSMTQGGKRTISFMSQALGLMADLDIGTDHLRWMGETRFMYGLLRGVMQFKPCPVQLSFKMFENDKDKMAATVQARRKEVDTTTPMSIPIASEESACDALPPLKHHQEDVEGWTVFKEPILYVYAGKGPYVARDFMAFPVSLPDDGLIDVMAMPLSSRGDLIEAMDGAPEGISFWHPKVHYIKAHAYRIKPLQKKGYLAVDGEPFPFEEFQVEVHKSLGTLLSPYGRYAADFAPRPHAASRNTKIKGKA
ncbi:ATP-NAD kinase-like domain-containing protein [Crassisporium funariophilum]|nr:ATP-NAD kinase-like domain-containing protein [Crassisporium funariophilum]